MPSFNGDGNLYRERWKVFQLLPEEELQHFSRRVLLQLLSFSVSSCSVNTETFCSVNNVPYLHVALVASSDFFLCA